MAKKKKEKESIETPLNEETATEKTETPTESKVGKFWKGRFYISGIGLIEGEVQTEQLNSIKKFRPNLDPSTITSDVDPKEEAAKRKSALKRRNSTGK